MKRPDRARYYHLTTAQLRAIQAELTVINARYPLYRSAHATTASRARHREVATLARSYGLTADQLTQALWRRRFDMLMMRFEAQRDKELA